MKSLPLCQDALANFSDKKSVATFLGPAFQHWEKSAAEKESLLLHKDAPADFSFLLCRLFVRQDLSALAKVATEVMNSYGADFLSVKKSAVTLLDWQKSAQED